MTLETGYFLKSSGGGACMPGGGPRGGPPPPSRPARRPAAGRPGRRRPSVRSFVLSRGFRWRLLLSRNCAKNTIQMQVCAMWDYVARGMVFITVWEGSEAHLATFEITKHHFQLEMEHRIPTFSRFHFPFK